MPWTTDDIADLTDSTAVVTGANSGLGLETARALAGAGAHVVMATRDQSKALSARAGILATHPAASLEIVDVDLGSFDSTMAAADAISVAHPTVEILINNAGVMAMPERRSADGYEMQFAVNHLGHWVFTAGLLASLVAAEAGRVVTVTSVAHHRGRPVEPGNVNMAGTYDPWAAYSRSKLANYHFGLALQREFEAHGARASSLIAHPGLSHTNLQVRTVEEGVAGRSARLWMWLAATVGMSAAQGALPQLRAATDPHAQGGQMYSPRFVTRGAPVRRPVMRRGNDAAIATLWEVSERETGVAMDVATAMTDA